MFDFPAISRAVRAVADKQELATPEITARYRDLITDVLDKAIADNGDGKVFVFTGDIPAMWLRDATFQVLPYLDLISEVPDLLPVLAGVLKQEVAYVQHDPYSNAFNQTASGAHWRDDDESDIPVSDLVWERKFEVDSLCAVLLLAERLHAVTGQTDFMDADFWAAVRLIVQTFRTEQHHESSPYFFRRTDCPEQDTLKCDGRGTPIGYTGMIWGAFRPSDDATTYGYHVPSNHFARTVLADLLPLLPEDMQDLAPDIKQLIADIDDGLEKYALVTLPTGKVGYAYEVDGLGNALFMDDANVPSLLSLPFLGACSASEPAYLNTREFVLSDANPYYYSGKMLAGVGSSHTPEQYVWPIAIAMVGLTTTDTEVQNQQLASIAAAAGVTGQCHEGIHVDDTTKFTRDWFSWANMTFCQLALHTLKA